MIPIAPRQNRRSRVQESAPALHCRAPEPPSTPHTFSGRVVIAIIPSVLVYSIASFIWPEGYVKYVVAVLAWLCIMWWTIPHQRPGDVIM